MAQRLSEIDWRPEVTVTIGPASLRLYPSNAVEKVQSEWMALDAGVAVSGGLRAKPGEAPEAKAKDKKTKVTKSKKDDKDAEDEEVCSEAPKKRPRATKN